MFCVIYLLEQRQVVVQAKRHHLPHSSAIDPCIASVGRDTCRADDDGHVRRAALAGAEQTGNARLTGEKAASSNTNANSNPRTPLTRTTWPPNRWPAAGARRRKKNPYQTGTLYRCQTTFSTAYRAICGVESKPPCRAYRVTFIKCAVKLLCPSSSSTLAAATQDAWSAWYCSAWSKRARMSPIQTKRGCYSGVPTMATSNRSKA